MTGFERRKFKTDAKNALSAAAYSPTKLALIHSAASVGLLILIAVLNFVLNRQIESTGGLSDIGSRSFLQTLQTLLQLANTILLPFWEMGLLFAMLSIGRGQTANPASLAKGFQHFGPILRGKLLQYALLMGFAFVGAYIGMFAFTMTPASASLYELAADYMEAGIIDYAQIMADEAFLSAAVWAVPFMLIGMLAAMLPAYYRLRLMDYVLLDQPEKGAFFAFRMSKVLMQGRRWDLFKLDMSFWWFYLLEGLVSLICYGDILLPMLGVELGMSQDMAFFLFYIAALLCQLGLYSWKKPYLLTTYAAFYDYLLPSEKEEQNETPLG